MLNKYHLCCGDCLIAGWENMDPRTELDVRISPWKWGEPICCAPDAEAVYVSYGFIYLEKDDYGREVKRIFDCLSPGGIFIVREDDNRKRIWRKPGQTHSTGLILSNSNPDDMYDLMEAAGFWILDRVPSQYAPIITGHKHAADKSYVLAGVKPCTT